MIKLSASVGPHASDDASAQHSLVGTAGFFRAVAFRPFTFQVVAGGLVIAALGDRHDI